MRRARREILRTVAGAACMVLLASGAAQASLTRNAAGAKNMGESGVLTLDTAGELEKEPDGKVWVFETAFQYEATERLQLLLEAVVFENQQPDDEESASGLGDTDVTISWMAVEERGWFPPVVVGAKVKLPTGGEDVGTGKADWSALLVLGKESGELESYLELEYATFGSPAGEELKDQLIYTLGAEYGVSDFLAVYAEVSGNSAPTDEESRTDAALAGVEMDLFATDAVAPYLSLEIDTEEVGTARAGVEWTW
jgi:hypothetical protein